MRVASLAEAWIETRKKRLGKTLIAVASLAEAWIETRKRDDAAIAELSPPSRRRGSKLCRLSYGMHGDNVASLAEAWIETTTDNAATKQIQVASLAEAWIETRQGAHPGADRASRLPRGGVDRNLFSGTQSRRLIGRLPRGGDCSSWTREALSCDEDVDCDLEHFE